jgi:hypothetical protein
MALPLVGCIEEEKEWRWNRDHIEGIGPERTSGHPSRMTLQLSALIHVRHTTIANSRVCAAPRQ